MLFLFIDCELIVSGVYVVLYLFSCECVYFVWLKMYLVIGIFGELLIIVIFVS